MKKILFMVTQSEFGGGQRFLYNLNLNIRTEYETYICVGSDGNQEFVQAIEKASIRHKIIPHLKRAIRPLDDIICIFEMVQVICNFSPDIVFLTSSKAGVLGTIASCLARVCRKKFSLVYRIDWAFNDPRPEKERKMYVYIERFLSRCRDIIIQNDLFDLESAKNNNILPKYGFKLIHNGIDIQSMHFLSQADARTFFQTKCSVDLRSFDLIIGNTANFYPTKGLTYMIEAVAEIIKTKNIACIIMGDGPDRPILENLIREKGCEKNIFLIGQIPHASRYISGFDLFAFTSVKEGFPWAILEAMCAGLPIIATRVGAIPEIIENGKSGYIIEPACTEQITERIHWFLEHQYALRICGENAKQHVSEHFTLKKMLEQYRSLFNAISENNFSKIHFD